MSFQRSFGDKKNELAAWISMSR